MNTQQRLGIAGFVVALCLGQALEPTRADAAPQAPPSALGWPAQASNRPAAADWKQAPTLDLGPVAEAEGCTAKRLREWLRIRCTAWEIEESILVAGRKADVDMWINGRNMDYEPSLVIEMPLRPGDRRLFQVNHRAGRWGGSFAVAFISELWLDGMDQPVLVFD